MDSSAGPAARHVCADQMGFVGCGSEANTGAKVVEIRNKNGVIGSHAGGTLGMAVQWTRLRDLQRGTCAQIR